MSFTVTRIVEDEGQFTRRRSSPGFETCGNSVGRDLESKAPSRTRSLTPGDRAKSLKKERAGR
jgi:hypothetical protein